MRYKAALTALPDPEAPVVNPDALRLFLAVCKVSMRDSKWFWSDDFRYWLNLVGWPEGDYRVSILRDMARRNVK